MKRSVVVRLLPSKEQEKVLMELALLSSKAWDRVNNLRKQYFINGEKIDFKTTGKIVYEEFKGELGSATVQQICRHNTEAWKSFFALLRKMKKGEIPKWLKPKPPNGIKDEYHIFLRNDQYKIKGDKLILKGIGKFKRLEVQFKGRIHLKGKQGRLEITYDPIKKRWYAHIPYTVEERIYKNKWVKIPREPLGNLTAGIDLGINNLMAVYVENGESFLVNGRPLKSIAFYWQRRIAEYQSRLNKSGYQKSRKLSRMYQKAKLQAKHYINTAVRQTVERLYYLGVSRIVVGYPKNIARNSNKGRKQNYLLSHVWRFNTVIQRLKEVAEEYGIAVEVVDEAFTSRVCPLCGEHHNGARFVRGMYRCPKTGVVMNADLVGAFNILKKVKKTITPTLPGLTAGRGNWGETPPEGLKAQAKIGLNETPQTSPSLARV